MTNEQGQDKGHVQGHAPQLWDVAKVRVEQDLYPRQSTNPKLVERYRDCLDKLPPIEVTPEGILIDGFHRLTAHKAAGLNSIPVHVVDADADAVLRLAITRNNAHGFQLDLSDKQRLAREFYRKALAAGQDRAAVLDELSTLFSVSDRTLRRWCKDTQKRIRQNLKHQARQHWLDCRTQEESAAELGVSQQSISDWRQAFLDFGDTSEVWNREERNAAHYTESDRPLGDVWALGPKMSDDGLRHPGNSHSAIVDNLLRIYTRPGDVVIDPFAGGGSSIDVCRRRLRRCYASDLTPRAERASEIRQHDLTDDLPPLPANLWQDVALVYLDPPYWVQAAGWYGDSSSGLANLSLDDFHTAIANIVKRFGLQLRTGAAVALLIAPTQYKAPGRRFTDHALDLAPQVFAPLHLDHRYTCPYSIDQVQPQRIAWAKEQGRCVAHGRDLLVWRVEPSEHRADAETTHTPTESEE